MTRFRHTLGFFLFAATGVLLGVGMGRGMRQFSGASQIKEHNILATPKPLASAAAPLSARSNKRGRDTPKGTYPPLTTEEIRYEFQKLGLQIYQLPTLSMARKLAGLRERIRKADVAAMAAAMMKEKLPPRPEVFRMVMSAFAEKDPEAAWAFAEGVRWDGARITAKHAILGELADSDRQKMLLLADGLEAGREKEQLWKGLVFLMSQKDPAYAWELAQRDTAQFHQTISWIFASWAMQEPEAAKRAAALLPGVLGERSRARIVESLARTNPASTWDYACSVPYSGTPGRSPIAAAASYWAEFGKPQDAIRATLSLPEEGIRRAAFSGAISSWARSDMDRALEFIVELEDISLRAEALLLVSQYSPEKPAEVLAAVMTHVPPGGGFHEAVSKLFSRLAEIDPAKAAAALKELPLGELQAECAAHIARSWSQKEGSKSDLFAWLRQLPGGGVRRETVRNAFYEISNPAEAVAALPTLAPEDQIFALDGLARIWEDKDIETALNWASGIPDEEQRTKLFQRAVGSWASRDPKAASRYVERLSSELRELSLDTLIQSWALKDAGGAANWVNAQPISAGRNQAAETMAREWMQRSPVEARVWISQSNLPQETKVHLLK